MTARPTLVIALLGVLLLASPATAQESRFASLDEQRVHYVNYGKGPEALVLIHGWSSSIDSWRDQLPNFARRNRVIAIDLPGHGASDKPELTYSMNLFAAAVEAVLRAEGVRRAVLVGHSMGTPVARQFYRKYPEQTLAIVVVDGPLQAFRDQKMMDALLAQLRGPGYQAVGVGMLTAMAGPNLAPELRQRILTSFNSMPQHVLVSAMAALGDSTIWAPDPIRVPLLDLKAKNRGYPADIEQRDRAIAPQLEFQLWEGVGHFLMMEQPKRFNDAVIAFLNKNALLRH